MPPIALRTCLMDSAARSGWSPNLNRNLTMVEELKASAKKTLTMLRSFQIEMDDLKPFKGLLEVVKGTSRDEMEGKMASNSNYTCSEIRWIDVTTIHLIRLRYF